MKGRDRPDLANYAEPRYHNLGFSKTKICVVMTRLYYKKTYWGSSIIYNSRSTILLFLENIVNTNLKCTKHNITKEVIIYKMARVLSSQHLSPRVLHTVLQKTTVDSKVPTAN